jgi:hypothetical protein
MPLAKRRLMIVGNGGQARKWSTRKMACSGRNPCNGRLSSWADSKFTPKGFSMATRLPSGRLAFFRASSVGAKTASGRAK